MKKKKKTENENEKANHRKRDNIMNIYTSEKGLCTGYIYTKKVKKKKRKKKIKNWVGSS